MYYHCCVLDDSYCLQTRQWLDPPERERESSWNLSLLWPAVFCSLLCNSWRDICSNLGWGKQRKWHKHGRTMCVQWQQHCEVMVKCCLMSSDYLGRGAYHVHVDFHTGTACGLCGRYAPQSLTHWVISSHVMSLWCILRQPDWFRRELIFTAVSKISLQGLECSSLPVVIVTLLLCSLMAEPAGLMSVKGATCGSCLQSRSTSRFPVPVPLSRKGVVNCDTTLHMLQTPSTGLRHPSFNHYRI